LPLRVERQVQLWFEPNGGMWIIPARQISDFGFGRRKTARIPTAYRAGRRQRWRENLNSPWWKNPNLHAGHD
jgi:hypothetical protein